MLRTLDVRSLMSIAPFSKRKTPRGQTAAQIPQPTQEARTIFCPRCASAY